MSISGNMDHSLHIGLYILFPIVAFLYASVGHGGASSYLMLMGLLGYAPESIRPLALLLNIVVSGIAFFMYQKSTVFQRKTFLILILFSMPAAFLGGSVELDPKMYQRILGILLLLPALALFRLLPIATQTQHQADTYKLAITGFSIGLVSGLIGIGGGILLSPILLFSGWANVKETALISALFICLNSVAGYVGGGYPLFQIEYPMTILLPLSILGGIAGAYLGSHRLQTPALRYLLATVLIIAACKFICL
jgi:uncharacterized membrane protein YfcA